MKNKLYGALIFFTLLASCQSNSAPDYEEPVAEEVEELPESDRVVTVDKFYSPQLDNTRNLRIYLPIGYETETQAYPVVYMQDGKNAFAPGGQFGSWETEKAYESLVAEGKIKKVILVGINNTSAREDEYTPSTTSKGKGGKADLYLDFITDTVMPYMAANYRVLKGPENTALMGSSLGGLVSFYAGWSRPQVFGMVGCLSSSFWWNEGDLLQKVLKAPVPKSRAKVYMDAGNKEGTDFVAGLVGMVQDTLAMTAHLEEKGWVYGKDLWVYLDPAGQHNETSWRSRVSLPLMYFFGTGPGKIMTLSSEPSMDFLSLSGSDKAVYPFVKASWENGLVSTIPASHFKVVVPDGSKWTQLPQGSLLMGDGVIPGPQEFGFSYEGLTTKLNIDITD